jgi:hypothetical protein
MLKPSGAINSRRIFAGIYLRTKRKTELNHIQEASSQDAIPQQIYQQTQQSIGTQPKNSVFKQPARLPSESSGISEPSDFVPEPRNGCSHSTTLFDLSCIEFIL